MLNAKKYKFKNIEEKLFHLLIEYVNYNIKRIENFNFENLNH